MPQYSYTAMDANGKEQRGKINAASEDAVASELKSKGLFPTGIKAVGFNLSGVSAPGKKKKKGGLMNMSLGTAKINRRNLTIVSRQIAILLGAGLPLIRSLRTVERQAKNSAVRIVIGNVANSIETGATFAESLTKYPSTFDKLYLNMVRAGEASGALEVVLDRLAGFMEKSAKIAGKVKSAMVYPLVVLTIAGGVVGLLMVVIVPKFKEIFSDMLGPDVPLPWLTQLVVDMGQWLATRWWMLLVCIALFVIFIKLLNKIPLGRWCLDWLKFHAPIFGPIVAHTAIARFAQTFGTLMASGVPVLSSLAIVRETSGNDVVATAIQQVHDAVKEGEGISAPLGRSHVFPPMVVSMVEVGEETGKLPELLEKVSATYEEEVDNSVKALTSMMEPIMILGLGIMVGGIVAALFMPMVSIIERLGAQ